MTQNSIIDLSTACMTDWLTGWLIQILKLCNEDEQKQWCEAWIWSKAIDTLRSLLIRIGHEYKVRLRVEMTINVKVKQLFTPASDKKDWPRDKTKLAWQWRLMEVIYVRCYNPCPTKSSKTDVRQKNEIKVRNWYTRVFLYGLAMNIRLSYSWKWRVLEKLYARCYSPCPTESHENSDMTQENGVKVKNW